MLTTKASHPRWLLGALALGLFVYAYGISRVCMYQTEPRSLLGWLLVFWGRGGDYAHGYLVPIVAAAVLWWKWRTVLSKLPAESSGWGLVFVALAMVLYQMGVRAQVPRLVASSFVVMIFGTIFYLGGWRWAKESWFPCAFLVFMIPLNFLDTHISFPLRMLVVDIAVFFLKLIGVEVYSQGTGIHSGIPLQPATMRFGPLDVADPCSGIRSLVALMALTSVYGYLVMDRAWKKWILFLSSLPLAVIGNLARITTVALVAQGFGSDSAMKIYHAFSGYIVFSLAILGMLALGALLNVHWRELVQHWLEDETPPTK